MDIFTKLDTSKTDLGKYQALVHGYMTFPELEGEIGPIMKFRGKEVITWSVNNYLGLGNLPEVRKADAEAAAIYAKAYNQSRESQEFYRFIKTMETCNSALAEKDWLILSTDGDFFKYLRSQSGR